VAGDEPGQVGFVNDDAAFLAGRIAARHQIGDLPSPYIQAGAKLKMREGRAYGRNNAEGVA
jgi:hypothetical protein